MFPHDERPIGAGLQRPALRDRFVCAHRSDPGTEAFDEAEDQGTPLEVTPVEPPKTVTDAIPLDQVVVRFD